MKKMDITGKWEGYYKYDDPGFQERFGHSWTNFTIDIHSFDGVRFTGVVNDDLATGGGPGTGTIEGRLSGKKIYFRKQMPVYAAIDRAGRQVILEGIPPLIYYSGTILESGQELKGHWKYKIRFVLLWGFLPYCYRPGSGFWGMRRPPS